MKRIMPPQDPTMFRRSAIGTGAALGALTVLLMSFQNCGPFRISKVKIDREQLRLKVLSKPAAQSSLKNIYFITSK